MLIIFLLIFYKTDIKQPVEDSEASLATGVVSGTSSTDAAGGAKD